MKAMKTLLVVALAAAGLAATGAQAQSRSHGGSGGGHWSGGSHGNWSGRFAGSGRHYGGRSFYGPRFGLFIGAPLLWSSYYWGSPYYWGDPYYYGYPRTKVIYRDREVEPYPSEYPDGGADMGTTEIAPRVEGAPSQAPTYMNYCESARAYFPKVTQCPEGWKFVPSR